MVQALAPTTSVGVNVSRIYREYIVPYILKDRTYCGLLYHQKFKNTPEDFFPQEPPDGIERLYIDPTVFMNFITRRECNRGHEPWRYCLRLFQMINDGVYEAVTIVHNFDKLLPNVMERSVILKKKARKKIQKEFLTDQILSQLKEISNLQVIPAEFITPPYLLGYLDEEDAIQFTQTIRAQCDAFVTYDSDYMVLYDRGGPRVYLPEQLVPKSR